MMLRFCYWQMYDADVYLIFQPHFGRKIITPPDNRTPVALLDKSGIPMITEEEVRGSGVGSDIDLPG